VNATKALGNKPPFLIILLSLSVVIFSSCSSLASRSLMGQRTADPEPCYFFGVRSDCGLIAESFDPKSDRLALESIYWTFDMPFSFGADVVLLPYDIYADFKPSHHTNAVVDLTPFFTK
jgi:uncharacterized protein YceK